ncbi:hypothetical protein ABZ897_51070 [Nonomuraea sp. NPDC046802]|uniref:hypothetical protein n=1 Tax=Nonomuraea sp. NPDC046802 TaxID=3154919 RepID=UPI003406B682
MRQATLTPPHRTVPMDYIDGDTSNVVRGLRYDMLVVCREHHIPHKYITPYVSQWGHGFAIQGADYITDRTSVILWTRQGHWQKFRLKAGAAEYRTLMNLRDYSRLLEAIDRDYPPGSLTAELTATLTQILQLWTTAKNQGENSLDLRPVDEIVAARLNHFVKAWLDKEADR